MATQPEHVDAQPSISTGLKTLLKEYPELRVDEKRRKVCCCLTGHEMPPREDAVRSYVTGKKFLKAQRGREYDFDRHKPHLIANTKRKLEHTLFCTLTLRTVTKRPSDVERHVNGKKYQRALKRWHTCQETGETFKPRGGKKSKNEGFIKFKRQGSKKTAESGEKPDFLETDSEDEADDDNLSDLYPSDDFASDEESEVEGEGEGDNDEVKDVANGDADSDDPSDQSDGEETANSPGSHPAQKRKNPSQNLFGSKKTKI